MRKLWVVLLAPVIVAASCKPKSGKQHDEPGQGESAIERSIKEGKSAGAGNWKSNGRSVTILVESGQPDSDCVYDVVMDVTDDTGLADEIYEALEEFEAPGPLLSLEDAELVEEILDKLRAADCKVGTTKLVRDELVWELRVQDEGSGVECMAQVLKGEFHATTTDEWKSKLSHGSKFHEGSDHGQIRRIMRTMESKCKCRIAKKYTIKR